MSLDTGKSASVTDALDTRITVRDFLDKPVPDELLRSILEKAMRSPSGGNLQPWNIHVVRGETLRKMTEEGVKRAKARETEDPTYPAYPSPLWEPHRSWRYKLGEDMYALLGIEKDNKAARLNWLLQNIKFFEAPVGLIITGDKRLGMPQYMDMGILLQSIMLLAREHGLHTAPQGWWRNWPDLVGTFLEIPDEQEVLVGMSLGYGNPDNPVNDLYADRAKLEEVSTFYD
ncbi:nitroreductase [Litorimonas haliclonae]|uniref:nitroreductase n=1 Tax=Litorimonas haliclonae TaxID=2081977 RepID=UPI0039F0C171